MKRAPAQRIVRAQRPAHPAIVSVATFTEAQLIRRRRAGTGNRAWAALERTRHGSGRRVYLLSGLLRCDGCGRKMQAELVRDSVYYRCRAKRSPPAARLSRSIPAR
ncbi:zinc ribbon domain-containing protein [Nocardia carnea]|uniref:zinc ribbon domain-containing protein n=1 Tax=Nocardia carnea TaxID=37328 RepID=UPI0024567CCE|nr:zinc ribbon domain-containing protein [Nocardia carnea]